MSRVVRVAAVLVTICAFFAFASTSLIHWGGDWHDQQRVGQAFLVVISGLSAFIFLRVGGRVPPITNHVRIVCVVLLTLGALSVGQSRQPMWAVIEFALQLGCVGLAWWVAVVRLTLGVRLDRFLIASVFVVCCLHVWQFMVAYVAFAVTSLGAVDSWLLLSGFSNPRFYGQFITLTLPLLALPLLRTEVSNGKLLFSLGLLSCWWAIAFMSGTRGTWLGLVCAMLVMFFAGDCARRFVKWLAMGALIGIFVCWLAVDVFPFLLGADFINHPSDRLSPDSTGRVRIWGRAFDMVLIRPWLGFGPMHFADQFRGIHEGIPAHPHQAFLQWASEWGLPSALLVSWLIFLGCFGVFRMICKRGDAPAEIAGDIGLIACVFGAVLASLVQGMVDGVFVMPVTETWLAILAGWLWGIFTESRKGCASGVSSAASVVWRCLWLGAGCVLMFAVVRDLPRLNDRVDDYGAVFSGELLPRFWTQGIISHEK